MASFRKFPSETVPFEHRTKSFILGFDKNSLIENEFSELIFSYYPIFRSDIAANYLTLKIQIRTNTDELKTIGHHLISYGEYEPHDAIARIIKFNTLLAVTLEENQRSAKFTYVIHDLVSYLYCSGILRPSTNTLKTSLQSAFAQIRKYSKLKVIESVTFTLGDCKLNQYYQKLYNDDCLEFSSRMTLVPSERYTVSDAKRDFEREIASRKAMARAYSRGASDTR